MCLAWTIPRIPPSRSACASSPQTPSPLNLHCKCIEPLPAALWGFNQACLIPVASPRICGFTLALRASRDVRLRDLAAPIDKNPALNLTQPCMRLWGGMQPRHEPYPCGSNVTCGIFWRKERTCILSDVNTSVSTSQAMMVTISSFIFMDGIPLRGRKRWD